MNNVVLSLFDGISCGQVAFERAGIKINKYFASEIKPHAIKVALDNYPNTIEIGDVTQIHYQDGCLYSKCKRIVVCDGGGANRNMGTWRKNILWKH